MIFEQIATGGCQSYLIGCADTCAAAVIDPEVSQVDRYLALAARDGLRIHFAIDTHTHADHFSAGRQIAKQLGVPLVMHRSSPGPVDLNATGQFALLRIETALRSDSAAAADLHACSRVPGVQHVV